LGYRRSSPEAPAFYIVDADGTIVDLEGFILGMLPHVNIPFATDAKPFDYTSVFGEQMRVLCRPIRGGIVIVSVIREEAPTDVDERLSENAARFGATVGEAAELPQKDVNAAFDYAVIDNSGTVRSMAGGIPLEIARPRALLQHNGSGDLRRRRCPGIRAGPRQ
jgi:hypothetical protein